MSFKTFINGGWKSDLKVVGMKLAAARPEILLIIGGVSMIAGTIYACTKTDKAKDVAAMTKAKVEEIERKVTVEMPEGTEMAPETKRQLKIERGKQLTGVYAQAAYEYLKLYGLPALLWFGGFGMIIGGHVDLRHSNKLLAADIFAGNKLLQEYRERVSKAVGKETEEKLFLGAQEDTVTVIEKDEQTGEERVVQRKGDIFENQPGSPFAINWTMETADVPHEAFLESTLNERINQINNHGSTGFIKFMTAVDVCHALGVNDSEIFGDENSKNHDERMKRFMTWGISWNKVKVPDESMRQLRVTKLQGYKKMRDTVHDVDIYKPCMRLDFNFYPLEGRI